MAIIDPTNPQRTFVTNFNADGQASTSIKLMTDERGHMYPFSQLFDGQVLGGTMTVAPVSGTMTVTISKGYVQIPSGNDYSYLGWSDASNTLRVSDSESSSRYTAIVAYIEQSGQWAESVTNNPGLMVFKAVDGNSSTEVDDTTIKAAISNNPYIVLAQIFVPAGSSSITPGNIIDKRQTITLKQGVGLPNGSYASGLKPGNGSSMNNNLQISVISPTAAVPTSADSDLLVIRLAQ